ncbi:MAG: energy transducer TonB [Silvibacterium sp.]
MALVQGLVQTSGQAATQTATAAVAAAAVMPKKPDALMLLGWKVNGVEGVDKPWHLKAAYQTFDADGKPTRSGTFEEWRASPEKWKWSFSGTGFNQALYRNGDKTSMTGDSGWAPFQDRVAVDFLLRPLAGKEELEYLFFTPADRKIGAVPLHCVLVSSVAPQLTASEDFGGNPMLALRESFRGWGVPTTCFNPDSAAARVELFANGVSALLDDVVQVDGQYVAKDIWIRNGTVPVEHLTVTTLEVPAKFDESDFAVPADATIRGKYRGGYRTAWKAPTYPPLARTQKIEGLVMIRAKITKTGDIADPEVISGPKELRSSAPEAVKTWKYEPYRLNGQPVEMSSNVSVLYALGR